LSLSAEAAAEAILRVANARMAGAIRLVSIERGHDPARFTAVPFGGGGALHVGALIAEVGLKGALVPRYPGVTSALGCIIADIRTDQVRTLNIALEGLDGRALTQRMAEAEAATRAAVADSRLMVERTDIVHELDMHYVGQTHTVAAPLSLAPDQPATETLVREAFEDAYRRAFSRLLPGIPVRIVNLRTAAIGRRPRFDFKALAPDAGSLAEASRGSRPVWFDGGWRDAEIWDRLALPVGAKIDGPAILEQPDATTVLDPGLTATVDGFGNLLLTRAHAAGGRA